MSRHKGTHLRGAVRTDQPEVVQHQVLRFATAIDIPFISSYALSVRLRLRRDRTCRVLACPRRIALRVHRAHMCLLAHSPPTLVTTTHTLRTNPPTARTGTHGPPVGEPSRVR